MDKTPENPSQRRSQKRPHSPQDEVPAPSDPKVPTTESGSVLQSDSKRDKLLRLLGGKKRKNETAASKWLERVRSREDELKVSTELESQFNESLTHKLSGASRRHIGIGFKEDPPAQPPTTNESTDSSTPSSGVPTSGIPVTQNLDATQNQHQQSIVGSLSNRANVPSLSAWGPRMGQRGPPMGYGPPQPYHGYGMGPPNMMPPQNYSYPTGCPPPPGYLPSTPNYGYGMPYSGQNMPPSNAGYGYQGSQPPLPPPPPPPPDETKDSKPPEPAPKTKSAFYAQFKKAS